ncbi:MAG: type II toxin-antitoxin system VapC family toxin [Pseudomonadota bacterium]|nr:type II toxin-antitoxin system VapC family toxin [Pseudomonadota bacterium]
MNGPPGLYASGGVLVETSALVAIILEEQDWQALAQAMALSACTTSVFNVFEASLAVASRKAVAVGEANALVMSLAEEFAVVIVPLTPDMIPHAIAARERYGRGRNGLNMGDCLSYAAAKALGLKLLYKGDDFSATDVND